MAIRYVPTSTTLPSPNSSSLQRADFETDVTSRLYKLNPAFNYVICEPKNDYNFTGERRVNWDHTRVWYHGKKKSH